MQKSSWAPRVAKVSAATRQRREIRYFILQRPMSDIRFDLRGDLDRGDLDILKQLSFNC